jgi:DNA-binding MurR/RpiR family transcriptional regulator
MRTSYTCAASTQPVTVVRLAKRYGFRGFLDFKMAFLAQAEIAGGPENGTSADRRHSLSTSDALSAVLTHHVRSARDHCAQDIARLESDWNAQVFCKAVTLLKRAHTVWMHHSKAALPMAHCHADVLRTAGLKVQWIRPQEGAHAAQSEGWSAHDVLFTLSLASDGEGDFDAVCMAQRMGVPVIALTDQAQGFLAQVADAHLCVAKLGTGMRAISVAIVLAHALCDAT